MNTAGVTVAIVDDDQAFRESFSQMLSLRGYDTLEYDSAEKALASGELDRAACFLVDVLMPGMSGIELLDALMERNVRGSVIIVTGHGDVSLAVQAMKKGAYDFIEKPFRKETALACVARAVEKAELISQAERLKSELRSIRSETDGTYGLLGSSGAIKEVRRMIETFADTDISVLVSGETGTGKELVARALHHQSSRKQGRFVAVNLASLPETLAMSELFGHEKGAFTGAAGWRAGKFEHASGGTLLLDEINSASKAIQAGILRAVEEKVITRLGGNNAISVDTRIVATTNRDLLSLVNEDAFRGDLFHRLSAVTINIPPLHERPEDIPALAIHFLEESRRFYDKDDLTISADSLGAMRSYSWPGNVRELKNTIVALALAAVDGEIARWRPPGSEAKEAPESSLKKRMDGCEKECVIDSLRRSRGNLKAAASLLQVPRRSLYDKMIKHGLKKEDFK